MGKPIFGEESWRVQVSPVSAHKEEAQAFVDFLAAHKDDIAAALHTVPGVDVNPPQDTIDPFYDKAWDMFTAADFVRTSQ
jgi:hypothetical protein